MIDLVIGMLFMLSGVTIITIFLTIVFGGVPEYKSRSKVRYDYIDDDYCNCGENECDNE